MVYVIQDQSNKNFWPASSFGKITFILFEREQATYSIDNSMKIIEEGLKTFSNKDYLILTGDPIAIGIATYVAAKVNKGVVNLLKWDRQEKVYIPVTVNFEKS